MSDRDTMTKVLIFAAGVTVGAALALLFAPKSGKETRRFLAKKAEASGEYVTDKARELTRHAEEVVGKGKELLDKQKERLTEALETSVQAARDVLGR